MEQTEQKHRLRVDENRTRIDAALFAMLMMGYLFTGYSPILLVLLYDLVVRLYVTPRLSPLYLFSTSCVKAVPFKERLGDAASKEFAANIALAVVLFTLAAEFGQYGTVALALAAFFLLWKVLEAAKDICFGCKLYAVLQRYDIEIVAL
jgi:hypothetical protein